MSIKLCELGRLGRLALVAAGFACFCPLALRAQHVHLNAGATTASQEPRLNFSNNSNYDTNAGYNVYLALTNAGSFSNLYQGAGISFTALASTPDNGGPAFGHATDGAVLQLQFVSMSGPPGGVFGVWMQDAANPGSSYPLFALPVGEGNGTNRIALSESDGSPGADPYGHIHGRSFTANQPGLYALGCRLVDTSTNGPHGDPIHAPSVLYYFYFQAGLTISSWARNTNSFDLSFGTTAGKMYYVESSPDPSSTHWSAFAGPFVGNNYLQNATTNSAAPQLYFRLRSN